MTISVIAASEPKGAALTLRDAIASGFDSVIVFGFKDEQIFIQASEVEDKLRLIGALDAAKMQIWEG